MPDRPPPKSARILDQWARAEADTLGVAPERHRRWISFMVISAMLGRVRDANDDPVFLLKGGAALELRIRTQARASKDFDAAFREAFENMIDRLDGALAEGWGDFSARRTEPQAIRDTGAVRVDIKLAYNGRDWGTVQLEVAPAEGEAGQKFDLIQGPSLEGIGLDVPTDVPVAAIPLQIGQKLHACTESIAGTENGRFHDLIDLQLLQELVPDDDWPDVRAACNEVFKRRGKQAWPPEVTIYSSWPEAYRALAGRSDFPLTDIEDAARAVRDMIARIDQA